MKLVRDKYDPDRVKSRLTETKTEKGIFLRAKLVEEAAEVLTAMDDDNLVEEIGDVLDVIDGLLMHYGINITDLEKVRDAKRELKGGFYKGVIKLK